VAIVSVQPRIHGTGLVYIDTRTYDVGFSTVESSWSPGGAYPEPVMVPDSALVGSVLGAGVAAPLGQKMRFLVIDRSPTYIEGVVVTYRQAGRLWTQRLPTCFAYGAGSAAGGPCS
jgi:hypothetical protein